MAAGLPIVAPARQELVAMVGEANAPFVVDPAKAGEQLPAALRELVGNVTLRVRAGQQNQARARSQFAQTAMVERFRRLYASALGREIKA
jgi:glycosyltransferase involved in cell wall biosynthesis